MTGLPVSFRTERNGMNAALARRIDDPTGNFPAIGNQKALDSHVFHLY